MKLLKIINVLLYFIALLMLLLSCFCDAPIFHNLYLGFLGAASLILLFTSVADIIKLRKTKGTSKN